MAEPFFCPVVTTDGFEPPSYSKKEIFCLLYGFHAVNEIQNCYMPNPNRLSMIISVSTPCPALHSGSPMLSSGLPENYNADRHIFFREVSDCHGSKMTKLFDFHKADLTVVAVVVATVLIAVLITILLIA